MVAGGVARLGKESKIFFSRRSVDNIEKNVIEYTFHNISKSNHYGVHLKLTQ